MSFIEMGQTERPVIIVGKPRTGKTTMAMKMLDEPITFYANEFIMDSYPTDKDILIEEVGFKPNEEEVAILLRTRREGKTILTSLDKKSIPKRLASMCKIKLAGSKMYGIVDAPRSNPAENSHPDIFTLLRIYLQNSNREKVADMLKKTRPSDTQIMSWLNENIHPNKLIFVDARVKRRWPQDTFYEMLAYAHNGRQFGKVGFPTRGKYSIMPKICRRMGLKPHETHLLKDLLMDENFRLLAKKKLNNAEYRTLGIGEKPIKRRVKRNDKTTTLEDFF